MYGVGQSPPRRRGLLVIIGVMVLALVLIGLFYGFYSLVLNDGSETPVPTAELAASTQVVKVTEELPVIAPTNTATSAPATATVRPTARPTNTAQPTATLKPPPEVITTGVRARVNISDGLVINLRDLPTLTGSVVITQLVAESEVDVIDGPEDEADLRWWNVDGGEDRLGWVVEGYGGETWLVAVGWTDELPPISPPVATATPTLTPTIAAPEATPVVTQTATPTLAPTATAEITATATPVLTPTATVEGEIPSPQIGGRVRVTTKYEFVNLRSGPGLDAETIGQLADATVATVLEGPEESDALQWWKVDDGQGNTGWAAERVGTEVLLVPVP